ncbi:MAG: 4Fe-4S dicluster domain-containing protein [Deltaproteobacteria bacterium]|nr:4Fe-4S dicluster domain-containing protein [Deltaproteobacteria bacterium]MBW2052768.1 4Fe-4S dicluster domain-containing protein [Deltaproteobacteria bacterium]
MSDQVYLRIAENIDKGIQTAPKANGDLSKAFIAFLKIVYTPEEADLVQHLSMFKSTSVEELADASGLDVDKIKEILSPLKRKAAIEGTYKYRLPSIPTLLNLHMFYPDIKPDDLEAAKLYQDFFIKEKFYKYYGTSVKGTPVLRSIPIEQSIHPEEKTYTAEEAHAFVRGLETEDLALVPCPCRTRTEKLDIRECKDRLPVANCVFLGRAAVRFEELGLGKRVTKEQAIAYIDEVVELGLIPTTDNSIEGPHGIMCMCCGCCCSNVRGRTRWDNPTAVRPSNFLPRAGDECILCGTCVDRCFLDALSLDEDAGRSVADPEKCIGCGVCTVTCPEEALKLHRFERPEPTFETGRDLIMTIARDNNRP